MERFWLAGLLTGGTKKTKPGLRGGRPHSFRKGRVQACFMVSTALGTDPSLTTRSRGRFVVRKS